ncbi:unnamed protein product [Ascophyllum nodosum]
MKLVRIIAHAISLSAYVASGTPSTSEVELPSPTELFPDAECPTNCEDLFSKLQDGPDGRKTQSVRLQVRGEPKSGTGMTQEWSWGALAHSCLYLQRLYGRESCRILWRNETDSTHHFRLETHSILFEPDLAAHDTSKLCTCDSVEKVNIEFSAGRKHMPVDPSCRWFTPAASPKRTSGRASRRTAGRWKTNPSCGRACRSPCVTSRTTASRSRCFATRGP